MEFQFFCACSEPIPVLTDIENRLLIQRLPDGRLTPCCKGCHEDAIDKRDFWHLTNLHHLSKVPLECAQCRTAAVPLFHPAGMPVRAEFVHCKLCLRELDSSHCATFDKHPDGCFFATFDKWPFEIVPAWLPIE